MPFGDAFSFEQTIVMRAALDSALATTGDLANGPRRRDMAGVLITLISEGAELDAPASCRRRCPRRRAPGGK
jgi:hypothetical protein